MKTTLLMIFLMSALGLGCSVQPGSVGTSATTSVVDTAPECRSANGHYYYLLCSSTGTVPGPANRAVCQDENCLNLRLNYEVRGDDAVTAGETCALVMTDACDTQGTLREQIGVYSESLNHDGHSGVYDVGANDTARFYGQESFIVHYPKAGQYQLNIARARAALKIIEVPQ